MRCRAGDIALIVKANHPENLGRIVEVISLTDRQGVWRVRGVSPLKTNLGSATSASCYDDWLRPIRDHGEDAQDETLQWLPAPEREGVAA